MLIGLRQTTVEFRWYSSCWRLARSDCHAIICTRPRDRIMHVEFLGVPRQRAGISELEVQADTLGQLLGTLAAQIPPLGKFIAADRLHSVVRRQPERRSVRQRSGNAARRRRLRADPFRRRGRVTEPMPFGYHGCYLRIDVSTGTAEYVPLDDTVLRQFIGGSGLGVKLLLDEGAAHVDPLAPEAPLVFAFSPLVGSPLTTSAKFAVVSKSPLTGRINDSLASSGFAIAGKSCGCDAIVIVGRAPELSVVVIDETGVRLEPAAEYRGATCRETEAGLKARLGANYRVASIGPAGEHLVRYATISHDGRHAGRGGSGAVLGAKNIKAIAVRGTQRAEWAHPQRTDDDQQVPFEAVVRSGDGEVPRAGHGNQSAHVQPVRRAADAQLSERHVRRSCQPLARAAEHDALQNARKLRELAPSAASTSTRWARAACASSMKACSRWVRCAE